MFFGFKISQLKSLYIYHKGLAFENLKVLVELCQCRGQLMSMTIRSVSILLACTFLLSVLSIFTFISSPEQADTKLLTDGIAPGLHGMEAILTRDMTRGQRELKELSQNLHSKSLKTILHSAPLRDTLAAAIGSQTKTQTQTEIEALLKKFTRIRAISKVPLKNMHILQSPNRRKIISVSGDVERHAAVHEKTAPKKVPNKSSASKHHIYAYDVFAPGILPSTQILHQRQSHQDSEFWNELKSYEHAPVPSSHHNNVPLRSSTLRRADDLSHDAVRQDSGQGTSIQPMPLNADRSLPVNVESHRKSIAEPLNTQANSKTVILSYSQGFPKRDSDEDFKSRTQRVLHELMLKSHEYNKELSSKDDMSPTPQSMLPATHEGTGSKHATLSPALIQEFQGQHLSCTVGASGLQCEIPKSPLHVRGARSTRTATPAAAAGKSQSRMSIGCAIPLLSENLGYDCHGEQHRDSDGRPLVSSAGFNLLDEALRDSVSATSSPALRPTYAPLHNHGRNAAAAPVHHADLEQEGVSELVDRIRRVQAQLRRYKRAAATKDRRNPSSARGGAS